MTELQEKELLNKTVEMAEDFIRKTIDNINKDLLNLTQGLEMTKSLPIILKMKEGIRDVIDFENKAVRELIKKELSKVTTDLKDVDIVAIQSDINNLEEENKALRNLVQSLQGKNAKLEEELASMRIVLEAYVRELMDKNKEE